MGARKWRDDTSCRELRKRASKSTDMIAAQSLVIDPVIEYSTYFGSPRDDRARAVATDSTGATYVAGSTATGGVSWGFVSKVNPGGTAVVYTVFFGSDVCDAAARGIAVDSLNNAIVTGFYVQQDAAGACNVKQVYRCEAQSRWRCIPVSVRLGRRPGLRQRCCRGRCGQRVLHGLDPRRLPDHSGCDLSVWLAHGRRVHHEVESHGSFDLFDLSRRQFQ